VTRGLLLKIFLGMLSVFIQQQNFKKIFPEVFLKGVNPTRLREAKRHPALFAYVFDSFLTAR